MISAVILTHNDSETLEKTLKSLLWCDEIVVVDDYSTDSTQEIAKKYKAKVYERHLGDDFASQRNVGLTKATSDWVLYVDSDEEVTRELKEEIKRAVSGVMNHVSGYRVGRKDFFLGTWLNHGETSHVRLLRLAKKSVGRWVRPVHEVWEVKGAIGELENPLLHYPHANVAQFLDEINRYSTLSANYLFHQGVKEPWWYIPGKPLVKFLVNYLLYQGYRDGTAGAVVAIMMSFHSFLTRAKLWHLWDQKRAKP